MGGGRIGGAAPRAADTEVAGSPPGFTWRVTRTTAVGA